MEYMNFWIYGSLRFKAGFREEVDKFIEATEKHAATLIENKDTIICPYKDCKNRMTLIDSSIIREHLIVRGFIEDYTVWIHRGETTVVDNDDDDEEDDPETLEYLSQYSEELDAQMDPEFGNKQGGDVAGGWDGSDEGCSNNDGGANNDGRARVGDEDDDDNLEDILWALGLEILQKSSKGLENLERVIKASKETVYGVEKGCPTHWTLLCFVLELLILKAKYCWLDYSFNDLLHLLSWLLPQPNLVPANTYQAKKVISPLTMGVEKSMHSLTTVSFFRGETFKSLDKCLQCGASWFKNNDLYSGGETSMRNKRNKKGTKKVVQESQPLEDSPLGNNAKQRRISALVMWYLPVTNRLRRIFLNPKEVALITWWDDERKVDDNKIAHPADCSQWQAFDEKHKEFSADPRNLWFGLSTDGINPFNERMSDHNT
jgi:hypothetical protein